VERFESEFAAYHGMKHGVSVSNGTAALELAFCLLGLRKGDEVILPTFTIISCIRAVLLTGATPVLIDVDPNTWNVRVEDIKCKITSKTRVILAVHTYGLPVDLQKLHPLCEEKDIILIEDVAEAIGLKIGDRLCGSFGHLNTFSFYPNKHITTGEGGMILTNNNAWAEKLKKQRNLGFEPEKRFVHKFLAPNYRLTNMQAAVGLAQLELLEETIELKRKMGLSYLNKLADFKNLQLPISKTSFAHNVFWVFGIILEKEIPLDADQVIKKMKSIGIGCREFFWPMHEQPALKNEDFFGTPDQYPVSSRIARRGLYLPSSATLSKDEISKVCISLKKILNSNIN
jgi:perosamine synthetase